MSVESGATQAQPFTALRRAATAVVLALLFSAALSALVLINNPEQGPLAFALIGTRFSEGDPGGSVGYDGQFSYFIARDGAQAVSYMDGPALRYQRILYPLAARALALGQAAWVPWTLLLLNMIAHALGAGLIAYLLARWGAPALLGGLIYALWIGSLFALRLNLHEPLCYTLGLAALLAYVQNRYRLTIVLLMLSALTKELGLVIAAGTALHAAFQPHRRWAPLLLGGPVFMFAAWWGVLRIWFGTFPTRYPAVKLHLLPLQGMFAETNPVELIMLILWLGLPALVFIFLALRYASRQRRLPLSAALVLAGAGFVLAMPDVSWVDPVAAYRIGLALVCPEVLFVGQCHPKRMFWLAALWMPGLLLIILLPQLWIMGGT